jgi:hypothetical protein
MKMSASKIVRALATLKGKNNTIYNDATTFGRSIKVWGWGPADYADAMGYLRDAGYKVTLVRTREIKSYGWGSGGLNLRLHVRG